MSMFIQNKLIRWILQPLANLSDRIPRKIRNIIFVLCGAGIFFFNVYNNSALGGLRYLYVCAFNCLMIGLMLLCTLPKELALVKFDKKLLIPWLGFTVFMLIAGLTKSVDYLADTMLFLVMFPVIFLIWNEQNFPSIVKLLIYTARVVAIGFFAVSAMFFSITGSKYASCFNNVNGFAFFMTALFVLLLIGFLTEKKTRVWRWVDLILLGICWALVYYSNSRTGQLACLIAAIGTLLLLLISAKKRLACLLWDILPVVLIVMISVQTVLPVFIATNRVTNCCREAIVSIFDKGDSPSTDGPEDSEPDASVEDVLNDIQNIQNIKTETDGKTANQFATGRIEIWKGFIDHITFWGHAIEETFTFSYRGETVTNATAHMTVLHFAYYYGMLAGVFYLLFNLIAGVKSIIFAARRSENRWALLPLAASLAYGCISLLASTSVVFSYMIALVYYLAQAPLMAKPAISTDSAQA